MFLNKQNTNGASMGRQVDPNNLSGGDVLRILAPLAGFLVALIIAGQVGAKYVWIVITLGAAFVLYIVCTLPKEAVQAITEAEQRTNDKIRDLPVVGPLLYPLWRVLGWAHALFGIATILVVLYFAYSWLSK
jgi:hypothetical protein